MHDLTAIQGDEPVGQRHYQTLPDTKKRSRSSTTNETLGLYITKRIGMFLFLLDHVITDIGCCPLNFV